MKMRLVLVCFIFSLLIMFAPFALAADGIGTPNAPVPSKPVQPIAGNPPLPAASQKEQPSPPGVNGITQAAVKAGVLFCTERINQVANFLTADGKSAAFLFLPNSESDKRIFSASLEVQGNEGPSAYASMSFAPNQANGCGGLYETVVYWDKGPDELATTQFASLKRIGLLYKSIIILDAGPNAKIFLMPAGKGCVSIKKEVLQ
jgi:hypothetical protein